MEFGHPIQNQLALGEEIQLAKRETRQKPKNQLLETRPTTLGWFREVMWNRSLHSRKCSLVAHGGVIKR